jgi:hypothetical protein
LKPIQIPIKPPAAVKIIDENERNPAPQRFGMNPPIVEPTIIKNQIIDFVFTHLVYQINSKKIKKAQHVFMWAFVAK